MSILPLKSMSDDLWKEKERAAEQGEDPSYSGMNIWSRELETPLSHRREEDRFTPLSEEDIEKIKTDVSSPRFFNLNRAGLMGQFTQEEGDPNLLVTREDEFKREYDPSFRSRALSDRFDSKHEIDHIVPVWAGGTDNPENKVVMSKERHKKKSRIDRVFWKLYTDNKVGLPEARQYMLNWERFDDEGVPDDIENLTSAKAEEFYERWTNQLKEPDKTSLVDALKSFGYSIPLPGVSWITRKLSGDSWEEMREAQDEMGEGVAAMASDDEVGEFFKGFMSGWTLERVPTPVEKYEDEMGAARKFTLALSRSAGHAAGFTFAMYTTMKGLGAAMPKIPLGVRIGADGAKTNAYDRAVSAYSGLVGRAAGTQVAAAGAAGLKTWARGSTSRFLHMFPSMALLGQMSQQEKEGLDARASRVLQDALWTAPAAFVGPTVKAGLLGVTGGRLAADTTVGVGVMALSRASGASWEESVQSGLIMGTMHHMFNRSSDPRVIGGIKKTEGIMRKKAFDFFRDRGVNISDKPSILRADSGSRYLESKVNKLKENIDKTEAPKEWKESQVEAAEMMKRFIEYSSMPMEARTVASGVDFSSLMQRASKMSGERFTGRKHEEMAATGSKEDADLMMKMESRATGKDETTLKREKAFDLDPESELVIGEGRLVGTAKKIKNKETGEWESTISNVEDAMGEGMTVGSDIILVRHMGADGEPALLAVYKTKYSDDPIPVGYVPHGETVKKQNSRLGGKNAPKVNDNLNAESLIDFMAKKDYSVMTATVNSVGIGAKSKQPYIRYSINENNLNSVYVRDMNNSYKNRMEVINETQAENVLKSITDLTERMGKEVSSFADRFEDVVIGADLGPIGLNIRKTLDDTSKAIATGNPHVIKSFMRDNFGLKLSPEAAEKIALGSDDITVGNFIDFLGQMKSKGMMEKGSGEKNFEGRYTQIWSKNSPLFFRQLAPETREGIFNLRLVPRSAKVEGIKTGELIQKTPDNLETIKVKQPKEGAKETAEDSFGLTKVAEGQKDVSKPTKIAKFQYATRLYNEFRDLVESAIDHVDPEKFKKGKSSDDILIRTLTGEVRRVVASLRTERNKKMMNDQDALKMRQELLEDASLMVMRRMETLSDPTLQAEFTNISTNKIRQHLKRQAKELGKTEESIDMMSDHDVGSIFEELDLGVRMLREERWREINKNLGIKEEFTGIGKKDFIPPLSEAAGLKAEKVRYERIREEAPKDSDAYVFADVFLEVMDNVFSVTPRKKGAEKKSWTEDELLAKLMKMEEGDARGITSLFEYETKSGKAPEHVAATVEAYGRLYNPLASEARISETTKKVGEVTRKATGRDENQRTIESLKEEPIPFEESWNVRGRGKDPAQDKGSGMIKTEKGEIPTQDISTVGGTTLLRDAKIISDVTFFDKIMAKKLAAEAAGKPYTKADIAMDVLSMVIGRKEGILKLYNNLGWAEFRAKRRKYPPRDIKLNEKRKKNLNEIIEKYVGKDRKDDVSDILDMLEMEKSGEFVQEKMLSEFSVKDRIDFVDRSIMTLTRQLMDPKIPTEIKVDILSLRDQQIKVRKGLEEKLKSSDVSEAIEQFRLPKDRQKEVSMMRQEYGLDPKVDPLTIVEKVTPEWRRESNRKWRDKKEKELEAAEKGEKPAEPKAEKEVPKQPAKEKERTVLYTGKKKNIKDAKAGDIFVAIWDGMSPDIGSKIEKAKAKGLNVYVYDEFANPYVYDKSGKRIEGQKGAKPEGEMGIEVFIIGSNGIRNHEAMKKVIKETGITPERKLFEKLRNPNPSQPLELKKIRPVIKTHSQFTKGDNLVSSKKLKQLKEKVVKLEKNDRPRVVRELTEAREMGDLSENAAYTEAKNELAEMDSLIRELKNKINQAVIIKPGANKSNSVKLGSKITILINGRKRKFEITGSQEADPSAGKISKNSPAGQAIMGLKPGEQNTIQINNKDITYQIVDIN